MPSYERFKLALSNIEGSQWRNFERLATVFLTSEYPSLRPMASSSGDEGMDATLFVPSDDPAVAIQISLRKDWATKIKETCERLKTTSPDTQMLIYLTNQEIGPAANSHKKKWRSDYGMFVDIRDREWFLTTRARDSMTSDESEAFCVLAADPILSSSSTLERQARALDDLEAKAAFVYLGLQWEDDTREKGLTKVCFEAMVRAVLRETTSEERMSRELVREQIAKLLPAQDPQSRQIQVDGALKRLAKVHLRHWTKEDEFCLTWGERLRLRERLAEVNALDIVLREQLTLMMVRLCAEEGITSTEAVQAETVERARSVLERVLLERGAAFAEAVLQETGANLRYEEVEALVYADFSSRKVVSAIEPRHVAAIVLSLLVDPPEEVRTYLRSLADTYTLFAFMRETPDVQSAIVKIFAEGDIWLDTSVVLPLLGEDLLEPLSRSHTIMFQAAREAGLNLFVTNGVVEELASHIHRSKGFYHASARGETYGSEPFLLSCYLLSGRAAGGFEGWLQTFCGTSRPEDDIADYLNDFFGIRVVDLKEFADRADPMLRAMVAEIWHEARERRAATLGAATPDNGTRNILVAHDVENYVGSIVRRSERSERRSSFGYTTWWLTLDSTAFRVQRELEDRLEGHPPASPAISPDFMLHYLAIGPVRARLSKHTEEVLPLMLNMSVLDAVPRDLLDFADTLRKELIGLPAHVVRRKIRDILDQARLLIGARGKSGENGLTEEIKKRLIKEALG